MYRTFSVNEIVQHLSIYSNPDSISEIDISPIKPFMNNPTSKELINILRDSKIPKEAKQAVLVSLNSSLNYTSVKPFLKDKSSMFYLLRDIPLNPMYTYEEIKVITEYVINKSKNTNVYSLLQVEELDKTLMELNLSYHLSKNGFQDIAWSSNSANADGIITSENEPILLYLRYGSGTGGAQNDRYRNMFDTAIKNPDKRFIFVVDGPEAVLQYNLCRKIFEDSNEQDYDNAIWTTTKLMKYVDFETLKFI